MKKFVAVVVLGILVGSGLGVSATSTLENSELISTEQIGFSNPQIVTGSEYVSVSLAEETARLISQGKPEVPLVARTFVFPFGTKINSVDVQFSEYTQYQLTKPVMPSVEPQILGVGPIQQPQHAVVADEYADIIVYPEESFTYRVGSGLKDGEHVVFVTIFLHPVQYQPAVNTMNCAASAQISITYSQTSVSFTDEYEFLIISAEEFTDALQPLVTYKNDHGTPTLMVTLADVPEDVGVDRQEDIKYFIKDAIETYGVSYVMLVGSGLKDEEKFPVRYAWVPSGGYEEKFPSDLYYADVYNGVGDFSDWDANDNGKYAELPGDMTEVDIYPDVYLCRLPCHTPSEAETFVGKIIEFEEHNSMMNTIVQIGGDTFPGDPEDINEGEYANDAVLDELPGYTSTKLWGSTGTLTKSNIIQGFYDGADFVDFSGHGSPISWATHPPGDETTWIPEGQRWSGFVYLDIDWLFNNKKYPVVVFNACSNSKYSESLDCLGWKMVKKTNGGGIASYGASGIGYGSYGSSEPERAFGWMEVHLFKGIAADKILGDVWSDCITGYTNSFEFEDFDYKTVLELALFGDPTLAIEDGETPEDIPETTYNPLFTRLIHRFPILNQRFRDIIFNLVSLMN